jgi:pyruvate kinase
MKKKTKIVATISDLNCEPEFIKSLYMAGMNVVRLNTAHQNPEQTLKIVQNVRKVSEKIALLLDTKGPEIRTSGKGIILEVNEGDSIKVIGNSEGESKEGTLYVNYNKFISEINGNAKILIDDGSVELLVEAKTEEHLICRVMNAGKIKTINL